MDAMGIDMVVTNNSATAVSGRQDCLALLPGQSTLIDVTARLIPASNPMTGFSFTLNYNATALTVTSHDPNYRLGTNAGSILVDSSEPLPDDNEDNEWTAQIADSGTG
jgi:hypothetical protein